MVARPRRFGDRDLALRMKELVAPGRGNDDGIIQPGAEKLDRHVDLAHIIETPREQLELEKALSVGAQRHFVVDARGHVAEVRRRHVLPRDGLEVEHIDRILGTRDEVLRIERRPDDGVGKSRRSLRCPGRKAWNREQGATGEKFQELPACRCWVHELPPFGAALDSGCRCSGFSYVSRIAKTDRYFDQANLSIGGPDPRVNTPRTNSWTSSVTGDC